MTAKHEAHVTVLIGEETRHLEVQAGDTEVRTLKAELSVPDSDVLYQVRGQHRRPLGDHETIDVESGEHFEAIPAGGVS